MNRRIIVVSNRLPVTVRADSDGRALEDSSGGLVTALCPILRQHSGCWIGWTGTSHNPDVERLFREHVCNNFELLPIFLSDEEKAGFYNGFSNEVVWPLFHDLQSRCNFDPDYWSTYVRVNDKFADTLLTVANLRDLVWVHDYHLMLIAASAKQLGAQLEMAYFHHIPFPAPDIFEKLPWRSEILRGLLQYSRLGFQTRRDRLNFVSCVRRFVPGIRISKDGKSVAIRLPGTYSLVGDFPIGIDFDEFSVGAQKPFVVERATQIKQDLTGCRILLGVDRLDYTKGIPERLRAFQALLTSEESLRGRVTLIQVVVPSRSDIPKYHELLLDIERLISKVNGQFGGPGWVPIHYVHRHLLRPELLAYYRAADIALITPLKDGMNLIAKEYCAARVDEEGVLILSEFAGAASQLRHGAVLVNPNDIHGVASAMQKALEMSTGEQRRRMRRLRQVVRRNDVYRWSKDFFGEGAQDQPKTSAAIQEPPLALCADGEL